VFEPDFYQLCVAATIDRRIWRGHIEVVIKETICETDKKLFSEKPQKKASEVEFCESSREKEKRKL
jgi:hypothetical protein